MSAYAYHKASEVIAGDRNFKCVEYRSLQFSSLVGSWPSSWWSRRKSSDWYLEGEEEEDTTCSLSFWKEGAPGISLKFQLLTLSLLFSTNSMAHPFSWPLSTDGHAGFSPFDIALQQKHLLRLRLLYIQCFHLNDQKQNTSSLLCINSHPSLNVWRSLISISL